jgi:hypothetical protein
MCLFENYKNMKTIGSLLLIICLIFVFIQDLKERKVTAFLLVLVVFLLGGLHYAHSKNPPFLFSMVINLGILCGITILLFMVARYFLKQPFQNTIGTGDLLFFMGMAIGFPTLTFVILFVGSLLFSWAISLLYFRHSKNKLVPLAGLQALFLCLVFLCNALFNFTNLYLL